MEAQANTTREQSKKNNIGWRPSHGDNGGVGKKKKKIHLFQIVLDIFDGKAPKELWHLLDKRAELDLRSTK